MAIPFISLALIGGSIYLIKVGHFAAGLVIIILVVLINIIIQFVKGGGIDALRNR